MASKIKTPALAKPGSVPGIARPGGLGNLRPPSSTGVKPLAKPSLSETPADQKGTLAAHPLQKKLSLVDAAGEPAALTAGRPPPKPTQLPPEPPSATSEDSSQNFAVGDRVLVGGAKPGVVAFLGPTQFAPTGIWAGVVLDTADGKNDGSVTGVRYFECEANRGVFARPDKLTLVAKAPKALPQPTVAENSQEASEKVFRVGDRVLVDGAKPGTIAFYGATEFAKGEWAGVALDAPDGKNDGTVAGVRYFECEPNHGLFAKPQKLVPAPKAAKPAALVAPTPANRSLAPPQSSTTQANEDATPSTQVGGVGGTLSVGCRVLVGGAKTGTLRYLGPTEFAKGVWAGVELDEAQGKNDGAVSGKRYFQCAPSHGVFSVLGKVELLPATSDSMTEASMLNAAAPVEPPVSSVPPPAAPPPVTPPAVQEAKNDAAFRTRSGSWTSSSVGGAGPGGGVATSVGGVGVAAAQSLSSLVPSVELVQQKELEKMKLEEEVAGLKRKVEDLQFLLEEQGVTSGDHLESVTMVTSHTMSSYKQLLEKEQAITASLREQLEAARSGSGDLSSLRQQLEHEKAQSIEQKRKLEIALQKAEDALREEQVRLRGVEEELKMKTESGASTARHVVEIEAQLRAVEERTLVQTTASSKLRAELTSVQEQLIHSKQLTVGLTKTLADKETELTEIQLALGRTNVSEADLKMQLTAAKDQLQLLAGDKAELEAQITRMSQLSGDSSSQLGYLNQQLSDKSRQLEELQLRCSHEARQVQEAREAARRTEALLAHELEQAKASHDQELKEKHSKLDQLKLELQQSRQECSEVKNQLHQSRQECSEVKSQLQALNEDFKKCEEHAAVLQSDLEQARRELHDGLRLADDRGRQLSIAQEEARGFDRERQLWTTREAQLTQEIGWLESEKQKAVADREKLIVETANVSSEHTELARQRMNLQKERDQTVGDLKALQAEHSKVLSEKDQMAKSVNDLKEQISQQERELGVRYSSTQTELTQAQGEIRKLKEEISTLAERHEAKQQSMEEQLAMTRARSTDLQHKVEQLTAERDSTLHEAQNMADKLQQASKEREGLAESLQQTQHQVTELESQLEEILRSNLDLEMRLESGDLQQKLSETEELLAARDRELTDALEQVKTLSEELVVSQGKRDVEELEQEKNLLEERVQELTVQLEKKEQEVDQQKKLNLKLRTGDKSGSKDVGGVMVQLEEAQQLVQDLQLREQSMQETVHNQESQIEFLNSVIADMQQKLETAESLAASLAGVGDAHGIESYDDEDPENLPPPRVFCDICEVFDQHDTDECPLQVSTTGSDSPPPSATTKSQRAPGGSDRPYCSNCEIFGHATEDCQYEATY